MNRIIYKRLLSTTNTIPKCMNCIHYTQSVCFKSPKSDVRNFINNDTIYELAVDSRNDINRCGNNGRFYEFSGPTFANESEKYLTICIFTGMLSGASSITCVTPSTAIIPFIPGFISFLSAAFYIRDHFIYKEMLEKETQRLALIEKNKTDKSGQKHEEYTTIC